MPAPALSSNEYVALVPLLLLLWEMRSRPQGTSVFLHVQMEALWLVE